MSKIKIFISLFLIVAVACIPTVCSTPDSDGIMPLNLHTLHTVTSFGFVDHHAFVNVDFMGYEETAEVVIESVTELGFDVRDIRYILHSHGHCDHTWNAKNGGGFGRRNLFGKG